jgi:hypothetical protein
MLEKELFCKSFITTPSKPVDSAPFTTQEGDLIYLLWGGDTPFLLQRVEGRLVLVGDCYVHGIMDGEFLGCDEELGKYAFKWEDNILRREVEHAVLN